MESQDKKKRPRKPNWTRDQCLLLASHVEDNSHIIKGKFSNSLTHDMKRQVWVKIADSVNAAYPMVRRTPDECERKWYAIQAEERRNLCAIKNDLTGTGKNLYLLGYHVRLC